MGRRRWWRGRAAASGARARPCSREGAAVVCGDVAGAAAEACAAAIRAGGGKAVATTLDVADPASIDADVRRTATEFGGADILLDSAGISTTASVLELTRAAWDRVLAVNLTGTFLLGQAVARQMVARGRGDSIVNVTSQLAEVGVRQKTAYLASKGGGRSLTIGMALDLAPYDIRVNAVAPGPTIVMRTGANVSYGQRRLVLAQMARGICGPCAALFAGAESPREPSRVNIGRSRLQGRLRSRRLDDAGVFHGRSGGLGCPLHGPRDAK